MITRRIPVRHEELFDDAGRVWATDAAAEDRAPEDLRTKIRRARRGVEGSDVGPSRRGVEARGEAFDESTVNTVPRRSPAAAQPAGSSSSSTLRERSSSSPGFTTRPVVLVGHRSSRRGPPLKHVLPSLRRRRGRSLPPRLLRLDQIAARHHPRESVPAARLHHQHPARASISANVRYTRDAGACAGNRSEVVDADHPDAPPETHAIVERGRQGREGAPIRARPVFARGPSPVRCLGGSNATPDRGVPAPPRDRPCARATRVRLATRSVARASTRETRCARCASARERWTRRPRPDGARRRLGCTRRPR